MNINIMPKKEAILSNNTIMFKDGFYLHDEEELPGKQEEVIAESIIPDSREAKIVVIEKDDILEEKNLDKNFKSLDSYDTVIALNKEKYIRGL